MTTPIHEVDDHSKLLNYSLVIFGLLWCIVPFFGFHPHHDGLMLSTITLTRDAIIHHHSLPFDQYGPFWIFIYALPSAIFPASWALLLSRLITILLYFVSSLLIFKIAKRIGHPKMGLIALFIAGTSHTFGLEPLPWPSSVAIPLMLASTYLVVRILDDAKSWRYGFLLGVFGVMLTLTRVQVGLASLFVSLVILWLYAKIQIRWLVSGAVTFAAIFSIFLASYGWLQQALTDEFLFGLAYIKSDNADKPHPFITLLLAGAIFLFFAITEPRYRPFWFEKYWNLLTVILLFIGGAVATFLSINYFAHITKENLSSETIVHRFWVSFLLAGIVYSLARAISVFFILRKKQFEMSRIQKFTFALALLAFASEIEIYPLFDPMHAWWSEFPGILSIALLFSARFRVNTISGLGKYLNAGFLISLVALTAIPFFQGLNAKFTELSPRDINGIYMPISAHTEYNNLRNFFAKNINRGDLVLNLCPDSNLFFLNEYAKPASRVFLYWDPMLKVTSLRNSLEASRPKEVVVCKTGSEITDMNTKLILKKVRPAAIEVASYGSSNSQLIQIWK